MVHPYKKNYKQYAAAAARYAYGGAVKYSKTQPPVNRKYNKTRKPTGSGTANASTFQSDKVVLYQRKPAPKNVKAAARRKYKAHQAQLLKSLSMQQFRFNTTSSRSFQAGDYNKASGIMFNTGFDTAGTVTSANSDYYNIQALLKGLTNVENTKIVQDHASIELLIKSTCDEPLVIDVYSVIAKKDWQQSCATTYTSGFTDNFKKATVGTSVTASVAQGDPFTTPFNQSLFGSVWTVNKCERFQLSAQGGSNSIISFNKRNPKNMVWDTNDFFTTATKTPTIAWKTQGYLIVARRIGDPTLSLDDAFTIQSNRTYNMKYQQKATNTVTGVVQ